MKSKITQTILSKNILRSESLKTEKAIRLMALDFLFDDMSSALDVSSQIGALSSLELFYEYSLLMRDAALDKAPWDSSWLNTLFQFEMDGEGIRIRPESVLYEDYRTRAPFSIRLKKLQEPPALTMSREDFTHHLNLLLSERLKSRIEAMDRILAKGPVSFRLRLFDPCIELVLHGKCDDNHPTAHELDESWFNRRARFYLQRIMILDNLYAFDHLGNFDSRIRGQR